MADTTTTNYGWTKPEVGGSNGSWGTKLNTDLDEVDVDVFAVSGVASAALPKAGGTMTGRLVFDPVTGTSLGTPVTATPAGAAVALDLNLGRVFDVGTFTGAALSFNFSNRPVGGLHPVTVIGNFTYAVGTATGCLPAVDAGDVSFVYLPHSLVVTATGTGGFLDPVLVWRPLIGQAHLMMMVRGS
jgi:hypothetical protein